MGFFTDMCSFNSTDDELTEEEELDEYDESFESATTDVAGNYLRSMLEENENWLEEDLAEDFVQVGMNMKKLLRKVTTSNIADSIGIAIMVCVSTTLSMVVSYHMYRHR